jgi:hypothetical protein
MYVSGQPGKYFDFRMWPFAYGFAFLSAAACAVAVVGLWHGAREARHRTSGPMH